MEQGVGRVMNGRKAVVVGLPIPKVLGRRGGTRPKRQSRSWSLHQRKTSRLKSTSLSCAGSRLTNTSNRENLLYYLRSSWDHPVTNLVYRTNDGIVWSSANAFSSNQPLEKQNDTGMWIRQQNERASTISHQVTGAQGNTFGMLIDQRKDFNLRFGNFDRTGCIRQAIATDSICSVYRR